MGIRIPRKPALVAGLAAAGLALFALRGAGAPPVAPSPPVPVQAVIVGGAASPESAGSATAYAAILHRDREAALSFRLGGRLAAVSARPGQMLPVGAVVARLEAVPYQAAASRLSADAARAQRTAERYAALAPEGAVAEAQARDAGDVATATHAGLAAARYDLGSTRLTMPFAGVVMTRHAEQGDTVAPGQRVVTVADNRSPWVATAQVPAIVAGRLVRGAAAQVRLAGRAELVAAQVLRIGGRRGDYQRHSGFCQFRSGFSAECRAIWPHRPSGNPRRGAAGGRGRPRRGAGH